MKLNEQQISTINTYIDEELINKEKLIEYLEQHRTIKNDIFKKSARRGKNLEWLDEDYCGLLDHPQAYEPVTRDIFIRRIPFYFHCPKSEVNNQHRSGLWHIVPKLDKEPNPQTLEILYQDLEFMFYNLGINLDAIFNYAMDQVFRHRKRKGLFSLSSSEDEMFGVQGEIDHEELFEMWRHYLHLCPKVGCTDYLPERFLTAYNSVLEKSGLQPIIYKPLIQYGIEYFSRRGNQFTCKGHFPCDINGKPILKWTNIRVDNAKDIKFSGELSRAGTLTIELLPNTVVYLLGEENYYDEEIEPDNEWHQIYAGPLTMEFNYYALKEYRVARGYTQKEVAEAIGANVRTYQKWENNESTPDGHYLLRIMNWLQIDDVQYLINYREPK